MTGRVAQQARWVTPTRAADGAEAALRLFCFSHAGGGTSLFQPWRAMLGPDIDVCPILLPGRESRRREPPIRRTEDLMEPLFEALLPLVDRPYALFGHSMGTILAFEMAQRFSSLHWRRPVSVIVSGRRAPHLPSRRAPYADLPDDEFLAAVTSLNGTPTAMLAEPELLRLFLPALRADFELTEAYAPADASVLSCPIAVMLGTEDPEVTLAEAQAWARWTSGPFTVRQFSGDHFYLANGRVEVVRAVRHTLAATARWGGPVT